MVYNPGEAGVQRVIESFEVLEIKNSKFGDAASFGPAHDEPFGLVDFPLELLLLQIVEVIH